MKSFILLFLILIFSVFNFLKAQVVDTVSSCPTPEEREKNSVLNVFPNPSNTIFKIVYPAPASCLPAGWSGRPMFYNADSTITLKMQDTSLVCLTPDEVKSNSLLNVFPNPSNGIFQIIYASPTSCPPPGWGGRLMIAIVDSTATVVYAETILDFDGEYNKNIDLTKQPQGLYIVEIVSGSQIMSQREVVNPDFAVNK